MSPVGSPGLCSVWHEGGYSNVKDDNKKQSSGNADSEALLGGNLTTRNSSFENNRGRSEEKESTIAKLYQATIPWNLSFRHTFGYSNSQRQNEVSTNSLQFSGSVELSPKWNVGISSGYDFRNKGITPTSLNFERDLDRWRMNINWLCLCFSSPGKQKNGHQLYRY